MALKRLGMDVAGFALTVALLVFLWRMNMMMMLAVSICVFTAGVLVILIEVAMIQAGNVPSVLGGSEDMWQVETGKVE